MRKQVLTKEQFGMIHLLGGWIGLFTHHKSVTNFEFSTFFRMNYLILLNVPKLSWLFIINAE